MCCTCNPASGTHAGMPGTGNARLGGKGTGRARELSRLQHAATECLTRLKESHSRTPHLCAGPGCAHTGHLGSAAGGAELAHSVLRVSFSLTASVGSVRTISRNLRSVLRSPLRKLCYQDPRVSRGWRLGAGPAGTGMLPASGHLISHPGQGGERCVSDTHCGNRNASGAICSFSALWSVTELCVCVYKPFTVPRAAAG